MKELSIEEKAKAYDELFVKAQQIYDKENDVLILHTIEDLFREIKDNEDERIRKELLEHCKNQAKPYIQTGNKCPQIQSWIAWLKKQGKKVDVIENFDTEFEKQVSRLLASILNKEYEYTESFVKWVSNSLLSYAKHEIEKQGEQEHVIISKIAPKFEIGDTIRNKINNEVFTITDRCISLEYYHDIHHLHEVKFSEQDNWELLKQKSADKNEPRFKVGDWVIDKQGIVHQIADVIENVTYHTYDYAIVGGGYFTDIVEDVRLWTIKDAKPGDVLASDKSIFIFQEEYIAEKPKAYCGLMNGRFIKGEDACWTNEKVQPANKEQCDQLERAMSDAGWEFDFEKKELKKIEQKPWNEEDEELMKWSIINLTELKDRFGEEYGKVGDCIDWLESIRPQNKWKASDEQMDALKGVQEGVFRLGILESLYNDLKKLKEE